MTEILISSPAGILAVLAAIASLFFFLEKKTKWKGFNYLPPLIFIYLTPVLMSNLHIIPTKAPVYDFMGANLLPMFLTIMLLDVNILATIRIMGKGIFVMLLGTVGVVVGAPIALMIVKHGLGPDVWKGFGALAGSWIGGTGNMLSVAYANNLDESSLDYGYAVIADNAVYLIWLPIMLASKNIATKFNKFTGISEEKVEKMKKAAEELTTDKGKVEMRHFLYLVFIGFGVTALATWLADFITPYKTDAGITLFSKNSYKILIVTFIAVGLSFTKASKIPASHAFSMALVYLFVARMGAKADLSNISTEVFWFLLGAYIWIFIHGAFLVTAAKIFKVDIHTAAISSAANIGGAASAPIVASYHNPALVPVSILMALLGYAIGNPMAILAGILCHLVM
ncbi:MAG: DUF819 family protein [Calditrichaeota bacterium]|nr:MAG: DUF819 family protein [Calditrichota bacterium]